MKLKISSTPTGRVKIEDENNFSVCNMTSTVEKENIKNAEEIVSRYNNFVELYIQCELFMGVLKKLNTFNGGDLQNQIFDVEIKRLQEVIDNAKI